MRWGGSGGVEPPVIQGKSCNVRDVLFCICGMVLDIPKAVIEIAGETQVPAPFPKQGMMGYANILYRNTDISLFP